MQKGRNKRGVRQSGDFFVVSAGCQDGNLGVELWLNVKAPYGRLGGKDLVLSPSHARVLFSDPRILITRIQAPCLDVVSMVIHAPHTGVPREEVVDFWTLATLQALRWRPTLVLADANARLGDH
eukprot:6026159-Pyramimonas_sp.AAC.1